MGEESIGTGSSGDGSISRRASSTQAGDDWRNGDGITAGLEPQRSRIGVESCQWIDVCLAGDGSVGIAAEPDDEDAPGELNPGCLAAAVRAVIAGQEYPHALQS